MSPPHFTFCISPNIISYTRAHSFASRRSFLFPVSSRRSTCNHPRPFPSCSQQSCHNCTHEIELSVPTHPENKTSLHCSEARTLIYLYSIDCRDRGLDRKTIRIAVNSRARFRSTNAPVPSPTPSHTTFYSTPVCQPLARTHAMKPYSTLRIHSYQSRVHKALVILRNPSSTKSDALQLVLRSRGGF